MRNILPICISLFQSNISHSLYWFFNYLNISDLLLCIPVLARYLLSDTLLSKGLVFHASFLQTWIHAPSSAVSIPPTSLSPSSLCIGSQRIKQNPLINTSLVHLISQIAAECFLPEGNVSLCWEVLLNGTKSVTETCSCLIASGLTTPEHVPSDEWVLLECNLLQSTTESKVFRN